MILYFYLKIEISQIKFKTNNIIMDFFLYLLGVIIFNNNNLNLNGNIIKILYNAVYGNNYMFT